MSKCYVDTIINLALTEVGYKGNNKYNKYAEFIDKNYPDFYNTKKNGCDWCDIFVDYLFIKAYGYENALRLTCQPLYSCGAGCTFSYGYYKDKGQTGKTPKLGAQIFFISDDGKTLRHTGIVVDYDYETVTTVEGNVGDTVCKKTYTRLNKKIYGYGYPKYTESKMKTVHEVALEVIDGLWGTGDERKNKLTEAGYNYEEVQNEVNKICGESSTLYVTCNTKKYNKIVIDLA